MRRSDGATAEIRRLLDELERLPALPAAAQARRRVDGIRTELDGREGVLAGHRRHLAGLERRRSWLESEVQGFRRALVMVGNGDEHPEAAELRLRRRLDERMAALAALDGEIDHIAAEIDRAEAAIAALRDAAIDALSQAVEAGSRAAMPGRSPGQAVGTTPWPDPEEMWSPVAVIGYRLWRFGADGLYGAFARWRTSRLTAECRAGGDIPHTDGRCARTAFGCGIYAAHSADELMRSFRSSGWPRWVVGMVGMEGKVVEHERGYRAERATVLAAVAVEGRWAWRFDSPREAAGLFADPPAALADPPSAPAPADDAALRRWVDWHMDERARRYASWTSADSRG